MKHLYLVISVLLVCSNIYSQNKKYDVSVILKVKFQTGRVKIDKSSYYAVDNVKKVIDNFPDALIFVVGHTDNIGRADSNKKLSIKRAYYINGLLIDRGAAPDRVEVNGMGEFAPIADNSTKSGRLQNRRVVVTFAGLDKKRFDLLKTQLSRTDGLEVIQESNVVNNYISKKTEIKQKKKPKSYRHLDRFSMEFGSFHSELSSKVISGNNSGSLSDEVLSNVRLAANLIQYQYFLNDNQYLAPLLRLRWYSFSKDISNFLNEDYSSLAWSAGLGFGHIFSRRFKLQANLVLEKQLYYFSSGIGQNWTIDLESSLRPELHTTYKVLETKNIDIDLTLQLAYLMNFGDLDNGHSWGLKVEVPFSLPWGRTKGWYFYTGYQQNIFDLNISEIKHEILDFGLGYKIKFF